MAANDKKHIEGGYVLTPRSKYDSDIWKYRDKSRLFELLIGKANHQKDKPQRMGPVTVGYGQYLRSYRKLGEDLEYIENKQVKRYYPQQIQRWAKELVREGRIVAEKTELGTLFTVSNYHIYQDPARYQTSNLLQHVTTRVQHVYNNNNSDNSDNSEKEDNAELRSAPDGSGKDYEERGTPRVTAKAPGNGEEKTTSPQDIVSEFARRYKLRFERPYFITRGKDQRRPRIAIETECT